MLSFKRSNDSLVVLNTEFVQKNITICVFDSELICQLVLGPSHPSSSHKFLTALFLSLVNINIIFNLQILVRDRRCEQR